MENKEKVAVKAHSTKHFDDAERAREYAIKLLEAGLTFLTIEDENDC